MCPDINFYKYSLNLFIRLVLVEMGLREKVALVLIAVVLYQTVCSLCVTTHAEENPFEKYMSKFKKGKIKSLSKHASGKENGIIFPKDFLKNVHKSSSLPEIDYLPDSFSKTYEPNLKRSVDVLSDSSFLNELRKEKRRKRKNKPNEIVYSRDDLPLTSLPDNFHNQETSHYFNEMVSFPEVQYPLTASETWNPSYWNPSFSNNNNYHSIIKSNQNKDKKKLIEAFLKPTNSIMKEILEGQEKILKNKSLTNHTKVDIDIEPPKTIIKDGLIPEDTESVKTKTIPPLKRNKSPKKMLSKAQNIVVTSKKIISESATINSTSELLSKETKSNNRSNNFHRSDSSNAANLEIETLDTQKNNTEILSDSALINTIQTFDPTLNHTTTDKESNQLDLILAVTATEFLTEQVPSNQTVLETNDKPDPNIVSFNDSLRQRIFEVLSTENLNGPSLRDNILKILQADEQFPHLADAHKNKDTLEDPLTENLADVKIIEIPLSLLDIISPPSEILSEEIKKDNYDTAQNEITQQLVRSKNPIPESLSEDSTSTGKIELTLVQETPMLILNKEPQMPASAEDDSASIITNELASDLREIITKPSDSRTLVSDLREIIRLLTIWNAQINGIDDANQNNSNSPTDLTVNTIMTTLDDSTTIDRSGHIPVGTSSDSINEKWSEGSLILRPIDSTRNDVPTDVQFDLVSLVSLIDTQSETIPIITKSDDSSDVKSQLNSVDTQTGISKDMQVDRISTNIKSDTINYDQIDAAPVIKVIDHPSEYRFDEDPVATSKNSPEYYQYEIDPSVMGTAPLHYDQGVENTLAATDRTKSLHHEANTAQAQHIPSSNQMDNLQEQFEPVTTSTEIGANQKKEIHTADEKPSSNKPINMSRDVLADDQTDKVSASTATVKEINQPDMDSAITTSEILTNGGNQTVPMATTTDIPIVDLPDKIPGTNLNDTLDDSIDKILVATANTTKIFDKPEEIQYNFYIGYLHEQDKYNRDAVTSINSHETDTVDSSDVHRENPRSHLSKTVFEVTNEDKWPSEILTFTNPNAVSLLAEDKEYSESLNSFIPNFMPMPNIMTDNHTKGLSIISSDFNHSEPYQYYIKTKNNTKDKTDEIDKTVNVFPDDHKLIPSDIDVVISSNETKPLILSDYITDKINYFKLPVELDETETDNINNFIPDSTFDDALSNASLSTEFPSKFTIKEMQKENESPYPSTNVSDTEMFTSISSDTSIKSQNYLKSNEPMNDNLSENYISSGELSIDNICPITEFNPIKNQCYVNEKPDALNLTSGADMSTEIILNAKTIDLIPEEVNVDHSDITLSYLVLDDEKRIDHKIEPQLTNIYSDTSVNEDIFDFTDYTLSPEDATTDFYDIALSNELVVDKYDQVFKTENYLYDILLLLKPDTS